MPHLNLCLVSGKRLISLTLVRRPSPEVVAATLKIPLKMLSERSAARRVCTQSPARLFPPTCPIMLSGQNGGSKCTADSGPSPQPHGRQLGARALNLGGGRVGSGH